jgi:hypothetical protein
VSAEITLRDVYDQQLRTAEQVAQMRADLHAHTARVDERLASGQRRMEDHEGRVRLLEQLMPERLSDRLTSLESDRDKSRGSSGTVGRILTAGIALAGGAVGAAVIQAVHH